MQFFLYNICIQVLQVVEVLPEKW